MAKVPPKFPESVQIGDEPSGYTLPPTRGLVGTVLQSDGAGEASWAVPAGGGGNTIRNYGTTLLIVRNTPADLSEYRVEYMAASSAFHIWSQLNSVYHLSYFDITTYAGGGVAETYEGLRFASRAEVLAWLGANIPQSGGNWDRTVRLRCYDIVDPLVKAPDRIWGNNATRARLKGGSNRYYDRGSIRCASNDNNWGEANQFLADLWEKVFGVPHPDAGSFDADSYGCFWFSGRKANFYRCAYEATRIGVSWAGSHGRRMVTTAGAVVGAQNTFHFDTTTKVTLALVNPSGDYWRLMQDGNLPDEKLFTEQQHLAAIGYSTNIALGMTDSAGNKMISLKPAGTDSYWLPWLDYTAYRYEYLGLFDVQGQVQAHTLPSRGGYGGGNVTGPWNMKNFRDAIDGHVMTSNQKPGGVRVQVRDLTTGHVSQLSNACIKFFGRRRYVQLSAIVQSRGAL